MKKFMTRTLSCVLTLALLFSLAPMAFAASKPVKQEFTSRLNFDIADSKTVTAIVVLEGESGTQMVKKGLVKDMLTARKKVASKQATVKKAITQSGAKLLYTYDTLLNGFSVRTTYGQLKDIEKMDGVSKVYLANSYSIPKTEYVPKANLAAETMGTTDIRKGGAGTVISIIDSSFNVNHEAFTYEDGLEPKLTKTDVESKLGSLNGKGVYATKKFPFVYDYYDGDTNVYSDFDHGTAVAGIAAGNNGDDYYGTAPNAQLLGMKVFPDDGSGTDSGVYFAALEDSYLLGADVINMSLGAQNGFSYDYELETEVFGNIYKTLRDAGIFVICAAGNEYSNAFSNYAPCPLFGFEGVTVDYNDYGVVGNPSTYVDAISIGSAENSAYLADVLSVDGSYFEFVDSSVEPEDNFLAKFYGQTLSFVVIPGVGDVADFEGIDVTGKVAVIKRGSIDFSKKLENAANAGAIAMICYNNEEGIISMQISEFPVPAISVTQAAGAILTGETSGKIKVEPEKVLMGNENGSLMSDFSSWGCTPDLQLKPQISGIGGMVTCADCTTTDGYLAMSGTSMAAPTVSGLIATLIEDRCDYMARDEYFVDTVMDLLYSYAFVIADSEGYPYSPRKQGSGVASLKEINSLDFNAYLDGAIANLGDDPDCKGVYTYTTTITGIPETTIELSDYYILTDYTVDLTEQGYGVYTQLASDYVPGATITTDKEIYTVGANGKVEITFTITLDTEAKEYLSVFPNGAFVEGFAYLNVNGKMSELHLTFMGFYGDWTKGPAFETYDWGDVVDIMYFLENTIADDEKGLTYAELGYTPYDMVDMNVGFNEAYTAYWEYIEDYDSYYPTPYYYLGANPYISAPFDPDAMAFSTTMTDADYMYSEMFLIYPSLLRNVRHIIMTVSDAETGEVYMVDDTEYATKNYYDYDLGAYSQYSIFYWDGTYVGEDGEIYFVPSGTVVDVTFQTQLDYEGAELKTEREYQITVDYEAPTATVSYDAEANTVTVSAYDNHYLSSFYLYYIDAEKEEYITVDLIAPDAKPDELYTYTFNLADYDLKGVSQLYVDVEDYATNGMSFGFSLGDDYDSRLKGDVNNDGKVGALDASLILQYDAMLIELNDICTLASDVNKDGKVGPLDASLILQYDAMLLNYEFGYVTLGE